MSTHAKAKQLISDMALIAGIQKHLANIPFIVQSQPETSAQVLAVIQGRVDKAQAVVDARAALHTAILASDQEDTLKGPFIRNVRQGVLAMFANSPTILADFGLVARKAPEPLTAAEKVLAAAKRAATRKARHTMGPRQKAKITGSLTGPIVVALDGETTTSSSTASAQAVSSPPTPLVANGSPSTPPS